MNSFRARHGLGPLPIGPEVDPTIAGIQTGVNVVTHFSDVGANVCGDMHFDYKMLPIHSGSTVYQAGDEGVADFREAFAGVARKSGAEESLEVSIADRCYGAYMAGMLLLPRIIDADEARTKLFDELVNLYIDLHPDESVDDAVRAVIGRTSATIALMQLKPVINERTQVSLMATVDSHKFTTDDEVKGDFFQHIAVNKAATLIGYPMTPRR